MLIEHLERIRLESLAAVYMLDLDRDKGSRNRGALLAVTRSIGKVIKVPVVATQIETAAMESQAVAAGIELLQGFSISDCLTADEAEKWLRRKTGEAA